MKEHLNRLVTIAFTDRKKPESGFLIDYSDEWILLKSNPADFIIDGFSIIRHKNIEAIYRGENEEFTEKVIHLKNLGPSAVETIPLKDIQTIFKHLDSKFGIFQFSKKSTNAIYPGRLSDINREEITIDWIDLKGVWSEKRTFKLSKIRIIAFENDYLKSLKLVADSGVSDDRS